MKHGETSMRQYGMKSLSPGDRPREKLERSGAHSLGDNELLAVIIGHGTPKAGALDLANQVIRVAGDVRGLSRLSGEELAQVPGVGAAMAGRLMAALELGRRSLTQSPEPKQRFVTSVDCGLFLVPRFGAFPVERFGVMLLDSRQRLIRTQVLAVGSIDAVLAHPRDVFRAAILAGASAIVAFHNHPTGDVRPSREDVQLTDRLFRSGDLIGIDVMDHLILGDTRYCSVRETGLVEWRE
jgi:DNA repair protein RadC